MKYVAYYRVSTDKQGRSGLGLEGQQAAVRQYLGNKGWPPIAEFTEVESGKRNARPQLAAALNHCKLMRATLVVAKLDRLSRNAAFLLSLRDAGVEFVCCDNPEANRLTVGILAMVAEDETVRISERTKAALQAAKARGVKLGGDRGYRPGKKASQMAAQAKSEAAAARAFLLNPIVQEIIKEGHASLAQIAAELSRREIPTPSQRGTWKPTMVSRVMKRAQGDV
jgi:DNA invertase Pin-like site-specific DNA recombinase